MTFHLCRVFRCAVNDLDLKRIFRSEPFVISRRVFIPVVIGTHLSSGQQVNLEVIITFSFHAVQA